MYNLPEICQTLSILLIIQVWTLHAEVMDQSLSFIKRLWVIFLFI